MTRSAPLMRLVLLLSFCLLGLAGCKSQCRLLSEQLCNCALNSNDKSACLSRAANAEGANPSTLDQEVYCKALLQPGKCDCRLIDTPQGKVRCGLARDPALVFDAGS